MAPSPDLPAASATIRSIQVGQPHVLDVDTPDPWTSGIKKQPVQERIRVFRTHLEGDGQADLVNHGGADKAVLSYSVDHFPVWSQEFPEHDVRGGCFGENLSISGLDEESVCIGDIYQAGSCLVQVSQPRQPCWKLARLWSEPKLTAIVVATRRTGWYLRVLEEGSLQAGDEMKLVDRPAAEFTVAWATSVMYAKPKSGENDRKLLACPQLSDAWRKQLSKRLATASRPT